MASLRGFGDEADAAIPTPAPVDPAPDSARFDTRTLRMNDALHDAYVDTLRRRLTCGAAAALATAPFSVLCAAPTAAGRAPRPSSSQRAVLDDIRTVDAGELRVHYADVGPAQGPPVVLLHGWPYDIQTYAGAATLLAGRGYRVVVPYLRGFGPTRFLSRRTPRNGQQAVLARDTLALLDALRIEKAVIGGCDWGARTANIVAASWPARCAGLVSVSGYLIGSQRGGQAPLPPRAELSWWYQFYFATERGRAGYERNRREFARLIWELASPQWRFEDATFNRSAASLDNPDHVDVVIHNYRWRLGLARGDRRLDGLEARLAEKPVIDVPTITLEGDANGAPHPSSESYASMFGGAYEHRLIAGGIGHNLPQEAPEAFAAAIHDVAHMVNPRAAGSRVSSAG